MASKNISDAATTPSTNQNRSRLQIRTSRLFILTLVLISTNFLYPALFLHSYTNDNLTDCAWTSLKDHTALLSVPRITRAEFLGRQKTLARELSAAAIDALITEPSATSEYYFNVSSSYELSERPFLVSLDRHGQMTYLVPSFEFGRISDLEVVAENLTVIQWTEEVSPYAKFVDSTRYERVMLDEHLRYMIASGLEQAGMHISPLSVAVQSIRSVKSEAEVDILRAINKFTLELIRSLQMCINPGMSQEVIYDSAAQLFTRAGLADGFWAIVLFGEQAANPHGGSHGQVLHEDEFVLIDIGSSLHGYGSDVTRTILPNSATANEYLLSIWQLVYDAQTASIGQMRAGEKCSEVDAAARTIITKAGYGDYFTHRLGHGLGLEMHEHPYLNGANQHLLMVGQVATNEPGIYITEHQSHDRPETGDRGLGVRIEDPVLVKADTAELLTGRRAVSPWQP